MPLLNPHPESADLVGFAQGTLSDKALGAVESHLTGCQRCRDTVVNVRNDKLVELLRRAYRQTQCTSLSSCSSTADFTPESHAGVSVPPPSSLSSASSSAFWLPEALPDELLHHPRYRIRRLLGKGGMCSVYEAEHRLMRRSVALKVINRAFTASVDAVKRFRREVRAAARLSHPNIVAAFDADHVEGTHFLVMEYVEGVNLGRVVRERGPLPVSEACNYARQAALGLQHAHEQGMVHRDVKPDNMIRCAAGRVKILDFGLAVLLAESGTGLTDDRTVMRTPEFMAPEQAEHARQADHRSDIYSLGCTLFYLLTGQPPYPADTPMLKLLGHREQPVPSIHPFRPDAPLELAGVLERLLEKEPQDRYASAGEVAAVLHPFTQAIETGDGQSASASHPARNWRRGLTVAILVTTLFVGMVLAAIAIHLHQRNRGNSVITTESQVKIVSSSNPANPLEASSRETQSPSRAAHEVFRKFWTAGRQTYGVDLSADGSLLISMHQGGARVWDVASGKLLHERTGRQARFTADAKKFITVGDPDEQGNQLRVYNSKSGLPLGRFGNDPSGYAGIVLPREGESVTVIPVKGKPHTLDLNSGEVVSENSAALYDNREISEFIQRRLDKFIIACVLPGAREVLGQDSEKGAALPIVDVDSRRRVREITIPGVERLGVHNLDYWLSENTYGRDRCPCVAVSRLDGTIHVMDLVTGKQVAYLNAGNFQPKCLALSGDGRYLAACASNAPSDVVVWRLPDPPAVADQP
jgi:serine/threonine protein kinase